jgi:inner membrane protein
MASAFSHAIASIAIGKTMSLRQSLKSWMLGIFCSIVPDADVIGFYIGIPYAHPFGHRGFTHSLFFAAILGILLIFLFYRKTSACLKLFLFAFFFLSAASHGFLDAFTNGGLGVEFFYPISTERYFFPWRPIQVSPINAASFFSERGISVLKSEFVWIWIPSFILMSISFYLRRKKMLKSKLNTIYKI